MSAPAFPLSVATFAAQLHIASAPFVLEPQQELSGLGSGELLTADLGPALYEAPVTTAARPNAVAGQLMALIESMGGAKFPFYLYDPMRPYPQSDPTGAILAASTPTIHTIDAGRRAMRITGLPAGYVITIGDYIAIDYGDPARRALVRALETAPASGAGLTPLFALSTALRSGIVTGTAVMLKLPAAKVKIVPKTISLQPVDILNAVISFRVRQTLQAG